MSKLLEPSELAEVGPVDVLTPAHDLAGPIPERDAGQGRVREQPRPRRRGAVAGPALALAASAVLLLALLAGMAMWRAGAPGRAVAVGAPAAPVGPVGAAYAVSPPNERDADAGQPAAAPASGGSYQVSPPNERDAGDAPAAGALAPVAVVPARDYTSDLGTDYDPFVIGSSRVRYTPSVPAALPSAYTGACRSDVSGCVPEERLVPGVPAALPAPWTGTCRSGSSGCEPEEVLVPGVPAPTTPVGTGRQQAELYAIEVRDNGAGTTGGDSGSCRSPGASCDR
jgi:hypothetical protein